jgi:hypothetical protein
MVRYYLNVKDSGFDFSRVWQYPAEAVDAYTPTFNVSEFRILCEMNDAKYLLLYEASGSPYFNTNLTAPTIYNSLIETSWFGLQKTFGSVPERIFVFVSLS